MYYNFNIGGKKTQCFYNDLEFPVDGKLVCGTMTTYDKNGESGNYYVVKDDEGRKHFVVNGEKIMFDDHICYTPAELVANLETIRDYNLCQTLMKYGMDSIRVMRNVLDFDHRAAMVRHDAEEQRKNGKWIEYKFVGEYLCEPKDNYKLKLTPVNEDDREMHSDWRTYVRDMVSLFKVRKDLYQVKANI